MIPGFSTIKTWMGIFGSLASDSIFGRSFLPLLIRGGGSNYIYPFTHLFPMNPFYTPGKHRKAAKFSDVFRGLEKGCIGNKWVKHADVFLDVRVTMRIKIWWH